MTTIPPETRYVDRGGVHIAYQVVGDGPLDLLVVPGFVSHLELFWEEGAASRHFLARLASFSRLIMFDKRGTGLSDRDVGRPSLEERIDDVLAVLDVAGSERAALLGYSEGGPMSILFAATHPARDGPARAVRCACSLREAVADLGVELRAGVHAGEVELRDDDVGGLAVHIAARVEAEAEPGEVLVSRTVKDLVVGSGLTFADRGVHALKGVPEEWQLYAVTGG